MDEQHDDRIDQHHEDRHAAEDGRLSRRAFGRAVAVAAPAMAGGVLLGNAFAPQIADAATAANWSTTGNTGSLPTTNYIGTNDDHSFVVRTNKIERLRISNIGSVGINVTAP